MFKKFFNLFKIIENNNRIDGYSKSYSNPTNNTWPKTNSSVTFQSPNIGDYIVKIHLNADWCDWSVIKRFVSIETLNINDFINKNYSNKKTYMFNNPSDNICGIKNYGSEDFSFTWTAPDGFALCGIETQIDKDRGNTVRSIRFLASEVLNTKPVGPNTPNYGFDITRVFFSPGNNEHDTFFTSDNYGKTCIRQNLCNGTCDNYSNDIVSWLRSDPGITNVTYNLYYEPNMFIKNFTCCTDYCHGNSDNNGIGYISEVIYQNIYSYYKEQLSSHACCLNKKDNGSPLDNIDIKVCGLMGFSPSSNNWNSTCQSEMNIYCQKNPTDDRCITYCSSDNINCDSILTNFCSNKSIDIINKDNSLKKVCSCFLPSSFYDSYYSKVYDKYPQAKSMISQDPTCSYGNCSMSDLKTYQRKRSLSSCPAVTACFQNLEITNKGQITGDISNNSQTCNIFKPPVSSSQSNSNKKLIILIVLALIFIILIVFMDDIIELFQ